MNGMEMLMIMNDVDIAYITAADNRRTRYRIRPLLAAAAAALLLALAGCAAYLLGMQELTVGTLQYTAAGEPKERQALTLSGYRGSKQYRAAAEWLEYRNAHPAETDALPDFGSEYEAYRVENEEMVQEINRLAKRYDLKLQGSVTKYTDSSELLAALGADSPIREGSGLRDVSYKNGTLCESGDFYLWATFSMPHGPQYWKYPITMRYTFSGKDYLNLWMYFPNTDEDWREWHYTTSAGEELLILRSEQDENALLFCDCGDSLVSAAVRDRIEIDGKMIHMTDAQVEMIADALVFGR